MFSHLEKQDIPHKDPQNVSKTVEQCRGGSVLCVHGSLVRKPVWLENKVQVVGSGQILKNLKSIVKEVRFKDHGEPGTGGSHL
jgi:hypothetical protein